MALRSMKPGDIAMRLSRQIDTTHVASSRETPAGLPLLAGALLVAAACLSAPSAADASPRNGHFDVQIITSVGHHPHGSRHGRAPDRHRYQSHYDRGDRRVERARRYASQATAQASTAWRQGCARSGPRWSTSWDDHYDWALGAHRILATSGASSIAATTTCGSVEY